MMKVRLLLTITLLVSILWIGCGEKAVKLSLKFNEGDVYKYSLLQDSVTTPSSWARRWKCQVTRK